MDFKSKAPLYHKQGGQFSLFDFIYINYDFKFKICLILNRPTLIGKILMAKFSSIRHNHNFQQIPTRIGEEFI